MPERNFSANAIDIGRPRRGWVVGRFIEDPESLLRSENCEIKLFKHAKGDKREQWSYSRSSTSFTMLIAGKWSQEYLEGTVELTEPFDFTTWGPYVPHKWEALEESIMLTIRWPSIPGDNVNINHPSQVEEH